MKEVTFDEILDIQQQYTKLCNIFYIDSSLWDSIHCNYSNIIFCEDNRVWLIAEYLMWYEFVKEAKRCNVTYYQGIDIFLKEYKYAVQQFVKLNLDN